jgi:hypothetical protein
MKLKQGLLVAAGLCLLGGSAFAQRPGPGGNQSIDPALLRALGNRSFSAKVVSTVDVPPGKQVMNMDIAVLDGDVRTDLDMLAMGANLPPQAAEQMKKMGMDRTVTILKPKAKTMWMLYPSKKAWVEMPLPEAAAASMAPSANAAAAAPVLSEVGRETIDGHPAIKNKTVVTGPDGQPREVFLWTATDLQGFPVQLQTMDSGKTMTVLFKNVKLEKPAASLFEAPKDYTRYDDPMKLMMSGAAPPAGAAAPSPAAAPVKK